MERSAPSTLCRLACKGMEKQFRLPRLLVCAQRNHAFSTAGWTARALSGISVTSNGRLPASQCRRRKPTEAKCNEPRGSVCRDTDQNAQSIPVRKAHDDDVGGGPRRGNGAEILGLNDIASRGSTAYDCGSKPRRCGSGMNAGRAAGKKVRDV